MTATDRIRTRIRRAEPGWVFTPADLLDLGSPQLIGMVLLRLVREGGVRRLARGVYDVPRTHPTIGVLLPTADAIAQAVARRDGATLRPSEAMAANLLSLSDQVPARVAYETDGPSRNVRVGNLTIELRRRTPRKVAGVAPMSGLVFAALRSLGRDHVTQRRIGHLRSTLSPADRRTLLRDLPRAPAWMHPFVRFIAESPVDSANGQRSRGTRKAGRAKRS